MRVRAVVLLLALGLCVLTPQTKAATGTGLSEAERAIYAEAFALAKKNDHTAARTISKGVGAEQGDAPLLNRYFRWLELSHRENEVKKGKATPLPFAALDGFLQAHGDWPRLAPIQRQAEALLPAEWSDEQVVLWFAGRDPRSVAGVLRLAAALEAVGGFGAATDLVRRTWRSAVFTAEEETVFLARHGALLELDDHTARLDRLLERREFTAAGRVAKRLGRDYERLAKARRRLMQNRPGVDAAIAQVPPELRDDPGLLYDRARWRQRRGRLDGVSELIDRADGLVTRPERWWRLRHWAARRALDRGKPDLAYRLASAHGLSRGVEFAEAEWLAGWVALRFEDAPDRAYRHFQRLHAGVSTPISRARGAYWSGEAAAQLGDGTAARDWYSQAASHATAFYGQQAIGRLGGALDLDLQGKAMASEAARQAFEEQELVRLVRLLASFDARRHVKLFMTHLRRQTVTTEAHLLHAELASEIDRPDQALYTAKQASRQGLSATGDLFPLPPEIARQVTGTRAPEPALVLAVIRQESAFDPRVISRAGARGLMQLMPATARLVAKSLDLPYRRAALIEEPDYNLRLGRAYLGQLLEDYKGSTALALAAYNAGPRRVERWIAAFGDPRRPEVDAVDWIERIPFSETRNYVQRVLEGRTVYRLTLNGQKTVMPLSRRGQELGARP